MFRVVVVLVLMIVLSACERRPVGGDAVPAVRLAGLFDPAAVEGTPADAGELPPSTEWRFDGPEPEEDEPEEESSDDEAEDEDDEDDEDGDDEDEEEEEEEDAPAFEMPEDEDPPVPVRGWSW